VRGRSFAALLVACVISVLLLPAGHGWGLGSPPRAAMADPIPSESGCSADPATNSNDIGIYTKRRCVAELLRTTRSRLREKCITDVNALNPNNPWYEPLDCAGGYGTQAEAIAQARLLARWSASANVPPSVTGGVAPSVQWEIGHSRHRVDALLYDPRTTTLPMQLAELKQNVRGDSQQKADEQLEGYINTLPAGAANRTKDRFDFGPPGTVDAFRVLVRDCSDPGVVRTREVNQYWVRSVTDKGVLMIDRNAEVEICPPAGDPPLPPIKIEEPDAIEEPDDHCVDTVTAPGPGHDDDANGIDDFWDEFYKCYPEMSPYPVPSLQPAADPVEVPVAVIEDIAAAIAFCALAGDGCLEVAGAAIDALFQGGSLVLSVLGKVLDWSVSGVPLPSLRWNVYGDPHLATLDGVAYDLQSVGEFHVLEIPDSEIDVQTRFTAAPFNVSMLTWIATAVGDHVVENWGSSTLLDGSDLNLATGQRVDLGDGGSLVRGEQGAMAIMWPGEGLRPVMIRKRGSIAFLLPPDSDAGDIRGLLGNGDGEPSNDFALRDGTQLPAGPSPATIHGDYADSWRISDEESFFTYGPGKSTATYTDLSAPANITTWGDFSAADREAASAVCADAGVPPGPQFDACALDVAATGDSAYAEDAAAVTQMLVAPDSAGFVDGHLGATFEGSVGPNFAAARYSSDAATSTIAGPLFDASGYRLYARELPRHDAVTVAMDLYAFGPVSTDGTPQVADVLINGSQSGVTVDFDQQPAQVIAPVSGAAGGSFDAVSLTPSGSGTTASGKSFSRYRLEFETSDPWEWIDVDVRLSGFSGVLNTSLGVDNIDLDLVAPDAQVFPLVGSMDVPEPAGSGLSRDDGAGRLESRGAADVYRFTVEQGGDEYLIWPRDHCLPSLDLRLSMTAPTSNDIGHWRPKCGRVTTPALEAGTYELEVSEALSDSGGDYRLQLLPIPDPEVFDYTLGDLVRPGSPGVGAGRLETVASMDTYVFDVAEATDIFFDARICAPLLYWRLETEAGTVISTDRCADNYLRGVPPGHYSLTFYGDIGQPTSYSFMAYPLPQPADDFDVTLPLTVTEDAPGAGAGGLETQHSADRYSFDLDAASRIYVDVQQCVHDADIDVTAMSWKLQDTTTGSVIASGGCEDVETAELPAGAYRIEVSSDQAAIGSYALQAWASPMAPESFDLSGLPAQIAADQPAPGAGTLETKASRDIYTFTLPDNRTALAVEDVTCSVPALIEWRLQRTIETNNVTIAAGNCGDQQVRPLPSGQYRLVVESAGEAHGTYQMRLTTPETATPTIVHAPQTTAYFGRSIPIEVNTTCAGEDDSCWARLAYRVSRPASGDDTVVPNGEWTLVNLARTGATIASDGHTVIDWAGEVPAAAVTTTGIDYYVMAGDGANRNELPMAPAMITAGVDTTGGSVDAAVPGPNYFHVTTVSPPLVAHQPPLWAAADAPLPIDARVTCSTGNCTATLHYRTSTGVLEDALTEDPGWPTISMTPSASVDVGDAGVVTTFSATIPGSAVDTRGVDYYIEVEDGFTSSWSPGTTYQGYYVPTDGMRTGYHTVHVFESPHIVHAPVLTSPYRTAIPINATSNCPQTRVCTARLYYRTTEVTGDPIADSVLSPQEFADVPMTVVQTPRVGSTDLLTIAGTIPVAVADTRGVDYYFRIDDGSTTTWWPGTGQLSGYVNVDGTRVGYQHVHVLEPPHIIHTPITTAKALHDLTVSADMTCVTANCAMTLHWRGDLSPGDPDPGWHTVAMTPALPGAATPLGVRTTWTATIPGQKVTTRGFAYYLEGTDGHVHDYSPGTGYRGALMPADGQHFDAIVETVNGQSQVVGAYNVRVLETPHPLHAANRLHEQGTPLDVEATSNCSSPACTAILVWTDAGGTEHSAAMDAVKTSDVPDNPSIGGSVWSYSATIPGAHTTGPFRYSITVDDGYTFGITETVSVLTYTPSSP